jgi:hypothetical protein
VSQIREWVAPSQDHPIPPRANGYSQSKAYRREDGYTAPTTEDRADLAVLAAAEALGYRIAVQCLDCGHWLSSPTSVAAHRGPRCRARRGSDR